MDSASLSAVQGKMEKIRSLDLNRSTYLSLEKLPPLEFSDCLSDSPEFKKRLYAHFDAIEAMARSLRDFAAKNITYIQVNRVMQKETVEFSNVFKNFRMLGHSGDMTDDEKLMEATFYGLGEGVAKFEEYRLRVIHACEVYVAKLEEYRTACLNEMREVKRKFERKSNRYYALLDGSLKSSAKRRNLDWVDTNLHTARQQYRLAAMHSVLCINNMLERRKFVLTEIELTMILLWASVYHKGFTQVKDVINAIKNSEDSINKCRESYHCFVEEANELVNTILQKPDAGLHSVSDRFVVGNLYILQKKAFGYLWQNRCFCQYDRLSKLLTITETHQHDATKEETFTVIECNASSLDVKYDRRFLFELTAKKVDGDENTNILLQALSMDNYTAWLKVFEYQPAKMSAGDQAASLQFDEIGLEFLASCFTAIEARGIDTEGIYRVGASVSKVQSILDDYFENDKKDVLDEADPKSIASGVKHVLKTRYAPLFTYELYDDFLNASKRPLFAERVYDISKLLPRLPPTNHRLLSMIVEHLSKVASHQNRNFMSFMNLSICFGPTLLRPRNEESTILYEIKFRNHVMEVILQKQEIIFDPDLTLEKCQEISNGLPEPGSTDVPSLSDDVLQDILTSGEAVFLDNLGLEEM